MSIRSGYGTRTLGIKCIYVHTQLCGAYSLFPWPVPALIIHVNLDLFSKLVSLSSVVSSYLEEWPGWLCAH